MHWRARVVAPILAVVLGIAGGVTTAVVTHGDSPHTTETSDFADPLQLGVPLKNLPCASRQAILVVADGDSGTDLAASVADNRTGTRYLETRNSCPGAHFGPQKGDPPAYILYQGPYPDPSAACKLRMTGGNASAYVATLKSGANTLVKCPCALGAGDAPELTFTSAPKPTPTEVVWIRALQSMLHDGDPGSFPQDWIKGYYTERTRRYIIDHIQVPAGYLGHNGVVDTYTWQLVRQKYCHLYDY